MPEITARILINLFLAAGALFALWRGGTAERAAAAVVIVNVIIGQTVHEIAPQYDGVTRLINDGFAAIAMLGITLRFAAQFSMHSYYMVLDLPNDRLHAIINNVDWSGIAWCLILGTAMAWRQRVLRARAARAAAA